MLKQLTLSSLLFLSIINTVITQELQIIEEPVLHYVYDKIDKVIYYRDFFTGEVYKTDVNSTFQEYFLSDGYIYFDLFRNSHIMGLLKYIENEIPRQELYFYDFDNDTLIYKTASEPFSPLGISISPKDENIIFLNEEPSYYSIIDDTLNIEKPNIYNITELTWRNDSSFYFIKGEGGDLYLYNYTTASIDTFIKHGDNYDRFTSITFNNERNILAYGYHIFSNNNDQLILRNINSGNEFIAYDKRMDDEELSDYSLDIKYTKWSPNLDKIAFFLTYSTIPASDIIIYNFNEDTCIRYTNWNNNYGAKYNLQWLSQDTILYEYEYQLYGFSLKSPSTIIQSPKLESFKLNVRNYPNPFNAITYIEIDVPEYLPCKNIRIDIYNLNGQRVTQLDRYTKKGNTFIFSWDNKNSSHSLISSGIYFPEIIIGNGKIKKVSQSHKIILIK